MKQGDLSGMLKGARYHDICWISCLFFFDFDFAAAIFICFILRQSLHHISILQGLAGRSLQEDDDRGPRSRSKRQLALVLGDDG